MTAVKDIKVKLKTPSAEEDVQLPERPLWAQVVGRPQNLADLDSDAQTEIDDNTATVLTLGDIAFLDSITTTEIDDDSITTPKIFAGAVSASKISVGNLSAINADLGTITAGTITGVLFRTASTGERIEIDTTNVNQIRFYDDTTLYGYIEADTVGSDGYINLKTNDGNGLQLDTGIGASGFNACELGANGGTFSTNGNASNGRIGMYANGANDYFFINRSAGTYKMETDIRIDSDWLPHVDGSHDLGNTTYRWQNIWGDDMEITYDVVIGRDLEVGGDLDVDEHITIDVGFMNLAQMSGATASGLTSQDGSMYYRTDDDLIRVKRNGTWYTVDTT